MGIILPDSVRLNMELEDQLELLGDRHDWLKHFDRELRNLDPYLSLVKASENATEPGLVPGYWHVKRDNPSEMATYYPLRGDSGEFVEPGSQHLDLMRRNDLQRPTAFKEFIKRQASVAELKAAKDAEDARERQETMAERIESIERAHVSMVDGWSNSVRGKKSDVKRTTD